MLTKIIDIPAHLFKDAYQTGSTVICNPPVTDTDIDYVVYTKELAGLIRFLEDQGFEQSYVDDEEYEINEDGIFCSLRLGNANLILTSNHDYFLGFCNATDLAKKLNLVNKEDRITLFKAVLYGIFPDNDVPF